MNILDDLKVGDLRTVGVVNEVVSKVLNTPSLVNDLIVGIYSDDEGLRMSCADALEKVTQRNTYIVEIFKTDLLNLLKESDQQEVQWHLAQIFSLISISEYEAKDVMEVLEELFQTSKSNIVKVSSLETMVVLSWKYNLRTDQVSQYLENALTSSAPSLRARARKLMTKYYD